MASFSGQERGRRELLRSKQKFQEVGFSFSSFNVDAAKDEGTLQVFNGFMQGGTVGRRIPVPSVPPLYRFPGVLSCE